MSLSVLLHSRTRYEKVPVKATLFGKGHQIVRWPFVEFIGVDFGDKSPLDTVQDAMRQLSLDSPEELRGLLAIPSSMLAWTPVENHRRTPSASSLDPLELLRHALILGLCSPGFYDPNRPVIWTDNRLDRRVGLFRPGRFYADN